MILISFIGVSASSKSFVKQQNNKNELANQISLMVRVERFGSADAANAARRTRKLQISRKSSESVLRQKKLAEKQ